MSKFSLFLRTKSFSSNRLCQQAAAPVFCPLSFSSCCWHFLKMSESAWQRCCVCSTHFDAVDPARPLLYRCVTCSDLSTVVTSTRNVQDCCLHICSKCYGSADLYHPSSHSWAKVFISNVKGYYQYKKADEWIDKVRIAATSLNQVKDDIFPTLRGMCY